jgi:hypothetical protein
MSVDNVGREIRQRLTLPIASNLHCARSLVSHLKRIDDLIHREIHHLASLFERLVASAAIVDTQFFKDSRGSRVL